MASSRFPSTVDDITVRLIAGVVLVVALVTLGTQQWWLYALLAVDFTLRAVLGPRWSPVARLVQRWVRPRVRALPVPTAGAPKRFAASIGAVLTVAATALWVVSLATGSSGALTAVVVIGVIMVAFPALESIVGYCVGCALFSVLMRAGLVPEEVCLDCADISRRIPKPAQV
ncbi:DUF4395 domain-containing protein [Sanguibacter antarcticus]|uniref:Uncharacterized protein DUF4395 n=1 Tax=Sanguibacter antarcticus TaxID=372484 RepID=A0A2A9E8I5_9MICO|nr:DUF4395 domain-containing protein [Sanguibacter antarcticus]PFG34956.1 uncharacterized protein DUF4395 [Sanguibacter antarcticus]